VAALACIAALPVLADAMRRAANGCALDGVAVDRASAARVAGLDGRARSFCSVRCAERWTARNGAGSVRVIDAPSGREIDARSAWFVRSAAAWGDGARDSIRAFARRGDAERHVRAYGGRLLEGAERPFGTRPEERHEATTDQ